MSKKKSSINMQQPVAGP